MKTTYEKMTEKDTPTKNEVVELKREVMELKVQISKSKGNSI